MYAMGVFSGSLRGVLTTEPRLFHGILIVRVCPKGVCPFSSVQPLRSLCLHGYFFRAIVNHRDTENTEVAQRRSSKRLFGKADRQLKARSTKYTNDRIWYCSGSFGGPAVRLTNENSSSFNVRLISPDAAFRYLSGV